MNDDPKRAARAIDALRRGWRVGIGDAVFLPIETSDAIQDDAFDPDHASDIVISASRAATLKIANQKLACDPDAPVALWRAGWHDFAALQGIADPSDDLSRPLQGPFRAVPLRFRESCEAALELARLAGILPAFLMREHSTWDAGVTAQDVRAYQSPERLAIVARARLPVAAQENAEIVAFRSPETISEHVALILGTPDGDPPMVRLHSECLTGDVLGSLKCDCGPQLHAALSEIATAGWGILLYLRQEGRGIGLINKLRAYELQDQGFDTVDANLRLGFAVDARDFGVAARMLDLLGQREVRLLTNNPAKVAGLEASGIAVIERVPHQLPPNVHNERYLATKRDRTGHQL